MAGRAPAGTAAAARRPLLARKRHRAEQNVFCGFSAANAVCVPLGQRPIFPDVHDPAEEAQFIAEGLSLFELRAHSLEAGGNLALYKRTSGAAVPVPSVVHWSYGHYSAITEKSEGRYRLVDPHLKLDIWALPEVIQEQASGYFAVPGGTTIPLGFELVSDAEARTVFGRHCIHGRDDEGCNPDTGCTSGDAMAGYALNLFNPGLTITDTPVRYQIPFGSPTVVQLTYNQRSVINASSGIGASFGPLWFCRYFDHIEVTDSTLASVRQVSSQGHFFTCSSQNGIYKSRYADLPTLAYIAGSGFRVTHRDGTIFEYFRYRGGTPPRYELTGIVDPQNHRTRIEYDAMGRVWKIFDCEERITEFSYVPEPGDGALLHTTYLRKITDPYGRAARFFYTAAGLLSKIVDCMGIVSEFRYEDSGFIDRLRTPYGDTTFAQGELPPLIGSSSTTPGRWIEATDAYGDKERVEQNDNANYPANGVDPNPPPVNEQSETLFLNGVDVDFRPKIDNLHWRNSYYWDKKAWSMGPGDYSKATIYNWLASSAGVITGLPGSIKRPLEGRVWFNYPGQLSAHSPGTTSIADRTLRAVEGQTPGQPPQWVIEGTSTQFLTSTYMSVAAGDAEGRVLTSHFSAGRLIALTARDNGTAKSLFSGSNFVLNLPGKITNASGLVTDYTYNAKGQVTQTIRSKSPQSETTRLAYAAPDGPTPAWSATASGYLRKIERSNPTQPGQFVTVATFTYDTEARIATHTDESGYARTFAYDDFDRLTKITHPDTTTEEFVHTNLSLTAVKDRRDLWTRYGYDALQQRIAEQDPQGRLTQYQWCKCGAISALIDPLGQTTRWKRDEQGRVMHKTLPDGTTKTSYTYQALSGRLATATSPKDQASGQPTVTYRYSPAGQRVSEDYTDPATTEVSYSYLASANVPDPLARLRTMTDGLGTTTYTYHSLTAGTSGAVRLATVNGPWADDTVKHTYDWQERLVTREVLADGGAVLRTETESFDSLGRVTQMVNNLGTFLTAYGASNLSHRPASITLPNGIVASYGYHPLDATGGKALRLQSITHSGGFGPLSYFGYDYDASGRITTWTQSSKSMALRYNRSSELIDAVLTDSVGAVLEHHRYRYDAGGNRYFTSDAAGDTPRLHNALNQLTQIGGAGLTLVEGTVDEPATVTVNGQPAAVISMPDSGQWRYERQIAVGEGQNTVTVAATDASANTRTQSYQFTVGPAQPPLQYDLNGNLETDGQRTFTWDAKNRLKSVTVAATGDTYAWEYDGHDRRVVEKLNGTETSRWLWDGSQLVQQRTPGNAVAENYFAGGEQWLTGADAGNYLYTRDHLGSIWEMVQVSTGAIRARFSYDPYGAVTPPSARPFSPEVGFTGHRYHPSTGLHLALYRAYDAKLGRWLSRDPIGEEGGLNLYGYVFNNPISLVDPLGLDVTVGLYEGAGIFGHIGIGVNTGKTCGFYPKKTGLGVVAGKDTPGEWKQDSAKQIKNVTIKTTPEQDAAVQKQLDAQKQNPGNFNLYNRNCATQAGEALKAGGIKVPDIIKPKPFFEGLGK